MMAPTEARRGATKVLTGNTLDTNSARCSARVNASEPLPALAISQFLSITPSGLRFIASHFFAANKKPRQILLQRDVKKPRTESRG
jgi:hypothetical protein